MRMQWGKTRAQRLAHHLVAESRFGRPRDTYINQWGDVATPAEVGEFHHDPARRMTYYTGLGQPSKANNSPAPVFLSATTLNRYATRGEAYPITPTCGWAGDSGAFTAMTGANPEGHPWHFDADEYGAMWVRLMEDCAIPPDFVAVQDWPCEPLVRQRTGLTVREHQRLSHESYVYLAETFPMVPWLYVLQGWRPAEYLEHAAMAERAGIDLGAGRVGIGSVCRRGSDRDIAHLVEALAGRGYALHGFGVSIKGLRRIGHLLASSDSQAWSKTARDERLMMPGCDHRSRPDRLTGQTRPTDCRNCLRYAMAYREEVLTAVRFSAAAYRRVPAPTAPAGPRYDQFPLFAA